MSKASDTRRAEFNRRAVAEYLETRHTMSLATYGAEGLWAAPVFYVSRDLEISFLSSVRSRHAKNIASNPRVAATIHDDVAHWRGIKGIQLEGLAEPVLDAIARGEALRTFRYRYPFVETLWGESADGERLIAASDSHHVYRVRPDRLYFIDHDRD